MSTSPSTATKLLAISGSLALIVFIVLGVVFHAWAWAWVVFLIPGAIRAWQAVGQDHDAAVTQGHDDVRVSHEGEEARRDAPPPQRYER